MQTLFELPEAHGGCLILAADTLLQRLPPVSYVQGRAFDLSVGQTLSVEPFRQRLADAGYASVGQVTVPGEFAVRGSLLDVFPMGAPSPLRIDLFGTDIEAIRRFDPETQRSLDSVQSVRMLPAREVPLDPESVKAFRRRYRMRFEGDPTLSSVYRGVSEGLAPPGVEFYLPLFFDSTASLFDYLPRDAVIVNDSGAVPALQQLWTDIEQRYEERRHDIERPILAPHELFLTPQELAQAAEPLTSITLDGFEADLELQPDDSAINFPTANPPELRIDARAAEPLAPLATFLTGFDGRVLITADSPGRREVLQDMLRPHTTGVTAVADWATFANGEARLALTVAPDVGGLLLQNPRIAVLSESQLFGARASQERRRRRSASDPQAILRDLTDLNPGSPVVHEEYGVGRYVGLMAMEIAGNPGEFLVLEYHGGDRIYVPVHALHLISRYTGSAPENAPLHKLGTDQWAKAKKRAAEQVRDIAAELLDLYARRRAQKAAALQLREIEYQAFANAFPFEGNRGSGRSHPQGPRRHGQVAGHGSHRLRRCRLRKTEVAMRAAFAAVQAGRQVAVLVPHHPARAAAPGQFPRPLCRLAGPHRSAVALSHRKESESVIEGIEQGKVDIVIATHRLLHANVRFRELGLIIVDEEHRFGVRDKEMLKALRAEVHVLTLTATPIPRTLNMALGGLRDLSLITTPPAARLAIKTSSPNGTMRPSARAVMRELRRGGQVYFVHNEIRDIEKSRPPCANWCHRPMCASVMGRCASANLNS